MIRNLLRVAGFVVVVAWIYSIFTHSGQPRNPLSRRRITDSTPGRANAPAPGPLPPMDSAPTDYAPTDYGADPFGDDELADALGDVEELAPSPELLASIKDYVDTPRGGIDWQLFGKTELQPYSYSDDNARQWMGVRPKFPGQLKRLDGKQVLLKGFMFPLGQEEKQPRFLLGPFPVSCPFHYDVTPNLVVEVHAQKPVAFSYDAVSIRGRLELVPQDDEYNVFYRLKKAKQVP